MQTRTLVGVGGVLGLAALALTQLSMQSQERKYKKTLQYMHHGRERVAERMNEMNGASKK
ncbi:hypothetical protein A1O1_07156 [Capronia coronata CBS 617.96]|uniref:Uncharacterized protein n=1 Tax=Capronia coronata CBS 617.96 TaxID=1182541 RepID=W9XTI1_9EURO|nr:uncharacterized protein A1O1_07156 [Capronia coronata CBS 617.96]EXJ83533.1 hypothetical protein A1O1_07156 [Capronia coronata CBS 617.96]